MSDWAKQLQQAPQQPKAELSETDADAVEQIHAELWRQIIKYQGKIINGQGISFDAYVTDEKQAEAYFESDLFRQLTLDVASKGYVLNFVGSYDGGGEMDRPHASINIGVAQK